MPSRGRKGKVPDDALAASTTTDSAKPVRNPFPSKTLLLSRNASPSAPSLSTVLTLLLSSSSCRCTLDELWDLAVKYVLPTIPAGDDGDRGGLKTVLFRELLERPDVSFESDAGRSALEAALQGVDPLAESGGAGGARVRCKQSRIDIALTNGQVTLLNLLSETDMKTLKFVGKARFEGLLQKNFKVTGSPQTMAYATILRLCDYGLLVRRDVVTPLRDDKGRVGSPRSFSALNCV